MSNRKLMDGTLTVSSNGNCAHSNITQKDGDEEQTRPPIIVLWLVELECLLKALLFVAIAILLISVVLLHWRWSLRRRIALIVLGRLLSVGLTLVVCALRLLGRCAACIVVGSLTLGSHFDR